MCVITHVRGDVGSDLSQDVLAIHKLDSDGHQKGLWGEEDSFLINVLS